MANLWIKDSGGVMVPVGGAGTDLPDGTDKGDILEWDSDIGAWVIRKGYASCVLKITTTYGIPHNTTTPIIWNTALLNEPWRNGDNTAIVPPESGTYLITTNIDFTNGNWGAGYRVRATIAGSVTGNISLHDMNTQAAAGIVGLSKTVTRTLTAGEEIRVDVYQNSGVSRTLGGTCTFSLTRMYNR